MIVPANKLLYCCNPLINHLQPFVGDAINEFEDFNYRDIFKQDLIELEKRALEFQVHSALIQELKYAMVALVDELILHSSWEGKFVWLGQPLQLEYFTEHLAGEGFFARLEMLRQNYLINYEILEIYYICIALGFAGIYRIRGHELLQALQVGLYQQIENARMQNNRNSNVLQPAIHLTIKKYIHIPFWIIPVIVIFIIFAIYFSYLYAIDNQAAKTLHQLDKFLEIY